MKLKALWLYLILLSLLILTPVSVKAAGYDYYELPLPPGWLRALPLGINNNDVIVGQGYHSSTNVGFIYDDGTYFELLPSNWYWAHALDINDQGTAVGWGVAEYGQTNFVYSDGHYSEVIPPGWNTARSMRINNKGEIVGFGDDGQGLKGFLFNSGKYTTLLPPDSSISYAFDINDHGVVVGWNNYYGFIYNKEFYVPLLPPGWQSAAPNAINNSGVVVGTGRDSEGTLRGFLYDDGSYTELMPPGWLSAYAVDINNRGEVIGFGYDAEPVYKGFLYYRGEYKILMPPGWGQYWPERINDKGVIVGSGEKNIVNHKIGIIAKPSVDQTLVSIDIMPNSCPNELNVNSKGLLTVAILGTDQLDVTMIDQNSLRLNGVPSEKRKFKNVDTLQIHYVDKDSCNNCSPSTRDLFLDLVLKFDMKAISSTLIDTAKSGDCVRFTLTGNLKNGYSFIGEDTVIIKKRH
ncbi:MAG: hypothetical protein ACOYVJ_09540 [Nitrospirota bacterium]